MTRPRCPLLLGLSVVLPIVGACGADGRTVPESGWSADANTSSSGGKEDTLRGADDGCTGPGPGCTCVPEPGEASCMHTNGGIYGEGACSESWQCCAGSWVNCTDCCGPCTCREPTGAQGCAGGESTCFPSFEGTAEPIPEEVREYMIGRSWHPDLGCPSFDSLVLLRMTHWGFDGEVHRGEMVVAQAVAQAVLAAFREIYDARFPIERMVLVDHYEGDDDASMAANNTSAFNCRRVTGGSALSQHSYGAAIDINPVQNPYVSGTVVLPPAGAAYLDRGDVRPGMVVHAGPVKSAFDAIGWGWGGDWSTLKDYQHVSQSGR